MKFVHTLLLTLCWSILAPYSVRAWGSAGHMVIAAEAFRQLSPETQAQVIAVLRAHPDYAKWAGAYRANPSFSQAAYVFMRCSTWPDEIRRKGSPYDHPQWHYIDYPLHPPEFPFLPDHRPYNNVLYGIAQCEQALSNTQEAPELKAVYLSWLVHLVGDIHQPLHCESFYSSAYPQGDRGGNDFYVKPHKAGVRLHSLWDGLLGSTANPQTQWNYAITLTSRYPRTALPQLKTDVTPTKWSLESRQMAIGAGYLNGQLKGGTTPDTAVALPPDYLPQAKSIAELQAALAGYRLADEIQTYLKTGSPVALLPTNTISPVQVAKIRIIGSGEADQYYNQTMTVTGTVVQVTSRPSVTFLNLDKPYPESPIAAVIFKQNIEKFKGLQKLKGERVAITGTITEYHNRPEMVLESPDQLKAAGN